MSKAYFWRSMDFIPSNYLITPTQTCQVDEAIETTLP